MIGQAGEETTQRYNLHLVVDMAETVGLLLIPNPGTCNRPGYDQRQPWQPDYLECLCPTALRMGI
jgi:hypothetical protein